MSALKRSVDLLLVVVAAPIFAPVMAIVAAAIRLNMGKPVLFRQERAGLQEVPFTLYKFRTMVEQAHGPWDPETDSERLTSLGRALRRWSLDELPQLWNVLKGDMSWVGPRPLPLRYLARYSPEQAVRHNVRPGLTGWAQINGRNSTTWPERFRLDAWYVANQSLSLDLRILFATVSGVIGGRGVSSGASATMHEFQGER